MRRMPLAMLLVERSFFADADEARRWVMAGKVLVNDQLLDKPGMLVPCTARVRVRGRLRYASRGGYKLEAALEHFAVQVEGRVALDCGASTGGFSDCLLQHGAALVYAVDAGHDQLAERLRTHEQVRNLENTNLSDLLTMELAPQPMLITLDLSYLSLTTALPVAATLLAAQGQVLALVKPLFEVESQNARRTGHIEDSGQIVQALQRVLEAGRACGLQEQGAMKLALLPRHGVHEFFVVFSRAAGTQPRQYSEQELYALIEGPGVGRINEES